MKRVVRPLLVPLVALLIAATGCDGGRGPTAMVKSEVQLTAAHPVAVVEFQGDIVLSGTDDDIVASFFRVAPSDSADLDRGNVAEFRQEAWLNGAWQGYEPGERPFIPLSAPGSNTVRYRWTFALQDGAESGVLPIEAGLTSAYDGGGVAVPGDDTVSSVTLEIISITYS